MQGVIRNGAGRRIDSEVWKHFRFDTVKNQSQCLVMLENMQCNKLISGKNTTNLKNLYGDLSSKKRNRTSTGLERRVL